MRKLKTGDDVFVIAGKDKGKSGKIIKVFPEEERVIVEGINKIKKHVKPKPRNPQSGIIEVFGKIHISNLMLICPKCKRTTRVGIKILEDKRKIRYCKKCGDFVDQI
jgi:large subunit ribosomal protein L24